MSTTEKKHAKFSASGSERWLSCPGSVSLSERAPPAPESKYAKEGTRAHECLEKILRSFIKDGTNPRLNAAFFKSEYGEEIVSHALNAAQYIIDIWGEKTEKQYTPLLCETKVSLEFIAPDMFGTVDAAVIDLFGDLHVFDFKYGAGVPVDPENNTQMLYYALGLAHKYDYNFESVHLTIIQPRAEHDRGPVRTWTISIDELTKWISIFTAGVVEAQQKAPLFRSGGQCRWCPAKPICPEISVKAIEQAQIEFEDKSETAIQISEFQMRNIGQVLLVADKLETWIEAVREYGLNQARSGQKVPGYKLVEKRSTRKWTDPDTTTRLATVQFGSAAFTNPELLSPAQFEKKFKGHHLAKKYLELYVTTASSGLTLVRDTDKRLEVNQIETDFTEVECVPEPINIPSTINWEGPKKKKTKTVSKTKTKKASPPSRKRK